MRSFVTASDVGRRCIVVSSAAVALAEAATPIGRDADEIDLDPRYQRPSLHNPSIHIDIL
jgi:hypothetical protein